MTDRPLFDAPPAAPEAPVEKLSPDRARTKRQRDLIAAGIHPLTGRALLPADQNLTCGDCWRLAAHEWHGRTYYKCELRITHGAATDVRKSWPACTQYLPPPTTQEPTNA